MPRPTPILCPICHERCGTFYPARISRLDGGDPEFSEGKGEYFAYNDEWYCSAKCMVKAMKNDGEELWEG